jgi:Zn-dependent protease
VHLPEINAETIRNAIIFLIALILSITVHEFGHAFVADRLGDRLPRSQDRVTLNPIAHIDIMGTIILPLLIALTHAPLLGWGKPVLTNPAAYTRKLRMKTGHLIVAAAGPFMNLVLATVVTLVLFIYVHVATVKPEIYFVIRTLIELNIILMFFNLIPLPPLDGGTVLRGLLPDRYEHFMDPLDTYGGFILLALVFTGAISFVLGPAYYVVVQWYHLWGLV